MSTFDLHHPWTFTFGILGNIVSVFVYLAPVPTFIQIYKEKSTMGYQSLPYTVALFASMLWLYYAFIKTNALLLISINSFGCVVETIYISLYLYYASKKARKHTAKLLGLMNVGLFSLIFIVTFFLFHGKTRVSVVGWIGVALSVSVFAAPLSIVLQVVRTRSVEFMPFPLSFFLTLSAVMWFGYGLFQKDLCVAVPNVLGFFLGLLQMLLYGIYRKAKPIIEEKKLPEHVIDIRMLGTPEVHPVDTQKCRTEDESTHQEESNDHEIENRDNVVPCAERVELELIPDVPVRFQLEPAPPIIVCAA